MVNQQRGHQKGSAPRAGHTNYTTAEEIPTGEEVLAGTFSLNEHPVIILFEGPEKATRGGVNGSQSKFLEGTRPISRNQSDAPLF
jgi:hypothetical protein